jgi:hypothetical protein
MYGNGVEKILGKEGYSNYKSSLGVFGVMDVFIILW